MNEQNNMKGLLSSTTLKIIATVFMVFDNVYLSMPAIGSIWHLITRFVAPLFAYLMVDGFFHTRSRKKYCGRLWIAAVLMQIGNMVSHAIMGKEGINDNIFLTLAFGFTILCAFEHAKTVVGIKKIFFNLTGTALFFCGLALSIMPIALPFGSSLMLEGGLQLLTFILIVYFFRNHRALQVLGTAILTALLFFLYGGVTGLITPGFDMFCVNADWLIGLVIPFMLLYNGEKGSSRIFGKQFFYIFYPLHLWIISIIAYCFG